MFRSILVPLDGSPCGDHALPLALTVARHTGAAVQVVHVHAPEDTRHPDWYLPPEQRSDPAALKFQTAYLEGVVRKLCAAGVSASMTVLEGMTTHALCGHVTSCGTDLVVMTTHGRGPLSRFWLGSVADTLVRRLTVPLLLVRPNEVAPDLDSEVPLRHFLIPLDGSPHAEAILGPALTLGEAMESDFTLLRVVEPVLLSGYDAYGYAPLGAAAEMTDMAQQQSGLYMDEVVARLRDRNLRVRPLVIVDPSAVAAILAEANSRTYDVVALETHGRGGASRLLLGSVADKIVRGASIPVLVRHSSVAPDKPAVATEATAF